MTCSVRPLTLALLASMGVTACSAGSQDLGTNDPDAGRDTAPEKDAPQAPSPTGGRDDGAAGGDDGSANSDENSADSGVSGAGPNESKASLKRVFVTSSKYMGDLGGLEGADEKCRAAADAASLGGTWTAWLSTSAVDAIDRIVGDGPWGLVDRKTKVFNNRANLTTTSIHALDQDEWGRYVPLARAWAGTDHGRATAATCSNWTTSEFSPWDEGTTVNGMDWNTSLNPAGCSQKNPIVCFER